MDIDKDLTTQLQSENEQLRQRIADQQKQIADLQSLPSVGNLMQINILANQIVQKTQVQ